MGIEADLMRKCQEQEKRIRELEAKLELQPCGHPTCCIRVGEQVAPGQFVHVCGWCESLDMARWQERARCLEIARSRGVEWGMTSRGTEARVIASLIAEADIQESKEGER